MDKLTSVFDPTFFNCSIHIKQNYNLISTFHHWLEFKFVQLYFFHIWKIECNFFRTSMNAMKRRGWVTMTVPDYVICNDIKKRLQVSCCNPLINFLSLVRFWFICRCFFVFAIVLSKVFLESLFMILLPTTFSSRNRTLFKGRKYSFA